MGCIICWWICESFICIMVYSLLSDYINEYIYIYIIILSDCI